MKSLYLAFAAVCLVGCGPRENAESRLSTKTPASASDDSTETITIAATSSNDGVDIPSNRKIIYAASLQLVVTDFDGLERKVTTLVDTNDGYIANADMDRLQGEKRSGKWVCRIPVHRYAKFLSEVSALGIAVARTQDAQDVSEEFVDLRARIANKRKLETRILNLLNRPNDSLQHVIEVEQELARVREEIERMEGRLRYLADKTSLATVTIEAREEREYTPPETPTFSSRISTTWTNSVTDAREFFESVLLLVVGSVIPFTIFATSALVAWRIFLFIRGYHLRSTA